MDVVIIENSPIERRTYGDDSIELRGADGSEKREIRGHGAVFNELSEPMFGFREQIAPGAFDTALGDDVAILFNHDSNIVMAATKAGTAEIGVDKRGLWYRAKPAEKGENVLVDAAVSNISRGEVNQSSFGFSIAVRGDEWDENDDGVLIRTITKVSRLYDQSPVTFPAYAQTDVSKRAFAEFVDARGCNKDKIIAAARARQATFEALHGIRAR